MNELEPDGAIVLLFVMLFVVLTVTAITIAIEISRQLGEAIERAKHPLGDALERYAFYVGKIDEIEQARNWNTIQWLESLLTKPPNYNEQERVQARIRRILPVLYEERERARADSLRLSINERNRTTLVRATGRTEELLRPAQNSETDSDELLRPA